MPPSSTLSPREQLELLIERFEQAWQAGTRPSIEEYLADTPLDHSVLLRELVHTDLEYRLCAGEAVRVEEYLRRFPELENDADELLELIEAEYCQRRRLGQQPAPTEYLERFPQHQDRLCQTPLAGQDVLDTRPGHGACGGSLPELVGRYRVDKFLARGGMGEVVRVIDSAFDRPLALKVLQGQYRGQTDLEERFLREARLTGQLQHPGVPAVQEMGRLPDGRPYFIMKLVKGRSLHQLLLERASLREKQTYYLGVVEQICRTVAYAHARGVIHRDLKPGNVMVGAFGEVQVMDWGLAKVLQPGVQAGAAPAGADASSTIHHVRTRELSGEASVAGDVLGTLAYMAPEQARGEVEKLDAGCDVFGLGGILCDLLTGKPPFAASANLENHRRAMKGDLGEAFARLDGCGADAELIALTKRCLSPERVDRPPDAGTVARAVAAYQEVVRERLRQAEVARGQARVRIEEERKRLLVERQKRRVTLVLAAAVLLVLLAGVGGTTVALLQAWEQTKLAEDRRQEAEKQTRIAAANEQKAKEQAEIARKVKEYLVEAFRSPDPYEAGDKVTVAAVLKQAEQQITKLDEPQLQEELLTAIGQTYLNLKLPEAVPVWEKVVALQTQRSGADDHDTLYSMNYLAMAYFADAQQKKALPLFEETLEKSKTNLGANDPLTLTTMNNLALAYQADGQLHKALPLYEEVLEKLTTKLGPDDPNTLVAMNNLATAYRDAGQLQKALPLLEEILEKLKVNPGPNHPHTLIGMNNLALAYQADGQLQKALPLLEENLEKQKAKLGDTHPDTLTSMSNLALAYQADGQLQKALPLLEETLEKRKATLGPDNRDTLTTMNDLALAYWAAGQRTKAIQLGKEALEKRKAKLGLDNGDTLTTLKSLGLWYQAEGQLEKALPLLEETLEKQKATLGPDNRDTLTSMSNLALAYQDDGQLQKALPLLEETLEKQKAKLGPDYPDTLTTMDDLAAAYQDAGRLDRAELLFRELIQLRRKKDGSESLATAGVLAGLGLNLLKQGKYDDAEPLLRECLAVRAKNQPDDWTTFNTRSMLGGALLGRKEYAEAEPLLLDGYVGMKQREAQIPLEGKPRLTEALDRLLHLYDAWGKEHDAAKWRALRDGKRAG